MMLLILLLVFALAIGLIMEMYKKYIRKDKATDLENRLVAVALSGGFAAASYFIISPTALPEQIAHTPWLIVAYTVVIYILQLPACMKVWKPIFKKALLKKFGVSSEEKET